MGKTAFIYISQGPYECDDDIYMRSTTNTRMNVLQFHKKKWMRVPNGKAHLLSLYVVVLHWPPLRYHNKELQLMCHRDGP